MNVNKTFIINLDHVDVVQRPKLRIRVTNLMGSMQAFSDDCDLSVFFNDGSHVRCSGNFYKAVSSYIDNKKRQFKNVIEIVTPDLSLTLTKCVGRIHIMCVKTADIDSKNIIASLYGGGVFARYMIMVLYTPTSGEPICTFMQPRFPTKWLLQSDLRWVTLTV